MNRWNDFEDRDRGLKENIEAYVCRFEEVFRELEVVGGMMLKSSGMEKLEKVKEKALYERMKTQNSLGLEGDITADHTNTKKK